MSRGSKNKTDCARSSLLSLQEQGKLEDLLGRRCAVSHPRTVVSALACLLSEVYCERGEKRKEKLYWLFWQLRK